MSEQQRKVKKKSLNSWQVRLIDFVFDVVPKNTKFDECKLPKNQNKK